jgi:Domain of unknown function (DUF4214)
MTRNILAQVGLPFLLIYAGNLAAQTACTGTITLSPARAIFATPITANITIRNAPTAAFVRVVQANGNSLTASSIPVTPNQGSVDLTLTIPNANATPAVAPLPTNNEQPQALNLQVFGSTSPDPIPCTITPATATIRKLPTATILSRDSANPPTFLAQVYSSQPIPANGTVTFRAGGTVVAPARPLSATESDQNTRTASYTPNDAIGVGTIAITAEFDGDINLLKSRSDESVFSIGPDSTPDNFSFAELANAPLGGVAVSPGATITGINTAASVLVTGGSYSINNAPFTAVNGTITAGQTIRLQHVSSCTPNTAVTTTITIGDVTRSFVSRTVASGGVSGSADTDGDGVPDAIECATGTNLSQKDNNIFGLDSASLTRYVQQMYRDFVAREADAAGLNFWTGRITRGEVSRFDLLSTFIFSAEYQDSVKPQAFAFLDANQLVRTNETAAVFVYAAYRSLLGRNPDAAGYNFWYGAISSNAQPTTAVLAAFYYAPEYVQRFIVTGLPPACTGTVAFAAANYEARNALSGILNIGLVRSSNAGACSVEVVLCTSGDCGTTVSSANYGTSGFGGAPLRQLVTFNAGQTATSIPLVIANATTASAANLRLTLQNASWGGFAITSPNRTDVAFAPVVSNCEFGAKIDGSCMPAALTRAQTAGRRNCFSEGNGPCLAWQVAKPATCPTDVRTVWQYNTNLPQQFVANGETVDYGPTKGFAMRANEVILFRFRTPAVTGLIGGVSALDDAEGNESHKFVSLSETPCDFSTSRVLTGDACYNAEAGNLGAGIAFTVSNSPVAGRCQLRPNTVYYLNVRAENPRTAPGVDDCASKPLGTCGYILNFNGIQQ